jgi:hypothetical protein
MQQQGRGEYPSICAEVGLSCETCTAATARDLAALCKGLRGKMIGQMFVQIHAHSACAPMHAHFAEHYRAACDEGPGFTQAVLPQTLLPQPISRKKGVAPQRLVVVAAVA